MCLYIYVNTYIYIHIQIFIYTHCCYVVRTLCKYFVGACVHVEAYGFDDLTSFLGDWSPRSSSLLGQNQGTSVLP